MTQIHPNTSNRNLNMANVFSRSMQMDKMINETSVRDGSSCVDNKNIIAQSMTMKSIKGTGSNGKVLSFIDHWPKGDLSQMKSQPILIEESVKPISLFKADAALINVAKSLTVSKMSQLKTPQSDIDEKYFEIDDEIRSIIESSKVTVEKAIKPYILEQAKQEQKELLIKIESSQLKFDSEKERMELLEATKESIREIASQSRNQRPQYTKALKSLRDMAGTAVKCSKEIDAKEMKEFMLEDALFFIEDMMDPVETSWKGIPGRSEDLPKDKPDNMSVTNRLISIKDHLHLKIEAIDAKQFRRLEKVADNPVFAQIIEMHKEGKLPSDGSIFFFLDCKRPALRIDACSNPKTRPGQSKESAIRHAVKTPEFLDIQRLNKGIGPDGAGLFRFAELTESIVGAVVLAPVVQDGVAVKLPGMSKPKRQVQDKIGSVPDCVDMGMSYGAVLNKFRPQIEKLLAERNLR